MGSSETGGKGKGREGRKDGGTSYPKLAIRGEKRRLGRGDEEVECGWIYHIIS